MRIAEAQARDEGDVVALWQRCGLTRPWNDPSADFHRAMVQPQSTVMVAHDDESLVGSVMVGDDGHRGWVYYLAVDAGQRRGGIGTLLMRSAEEWLMERGQSRIRLMVRNENHAVVGFYSHLGYVDQECSVLGRTLG